MSNDFRTDSAAAMALLIDLCPSKVARQAWAKLVMDSIRIASAVSSQAWELSAFPDLVRLNVGQIAVVELWRQRICLYTHGDGTDVSTPGVTRYQRWPGYTAVPGPTQRWRIQLTALGRLPVSLRAAHHRLVELAATRKPHSPFRRAHSPAVVSAIATLSGSAPATVERPSSVVQSAGFGDPDTNREVEEAAVAAVIAAYRARGWQVESVESERRGYDLLCCRGKEGLHVEVKGAGPVADKFLLTAGEYRLAYSDDAFVLAFVDGLSVGQVRIREWPAKRFRREFAFEAVQYWASLRTTV